MKQLPFDRWENVIINWFPGHMAKASKDIKEKMSKVGTVIEVRDARVLL